MSEHWREPCRGADTEPQQTLRTNFRDRERERRDVQKLSWRLIIDLNTRVLSLGAVGKKKKILID